MKPILTSILLFTVSTLACQAFVLSTDPEKKHPIKWDFSGTSTLVDPNVFDRITKTIRYYIAEDAFTEANREAELNAVKSSFDQWEAVPDTNIRFDYVGLAPADIDAITDNTNAVFWTKSTKISDGREDLSFAAGAALCELVAPSNLAGEITGDFIVKECDIALNGLLTWFTDPTLENNPSKMVEGFMLHEIGHLLGIRHSPVGASSMFHLGGPGLTTLAGLSADEVLAAQFLYPTKDFNFGSIHGTITKNGEPVLGAMVFLEDSDGNIISGSATEEDGSYEFLAVPGGDYKVWSSPVYSLDSSFFLIVGLQIKNPEFFEADTQFLPTEKLPVSLTGGETATQDFQVNQGISSRLPIFIRSASADPFLFVQESVPTTIKQGTQNVSVGLFFEEELPENAILEISGNDITLSDQTTGLLDFTVVQFHHISAVVSVAEDAKPGIRTFKVTFGDEIVYANGFLEILPAFPDYNFDGVDDLFQRDFWPLFTTAEADPDLDPDEDGLTNKEESIAGTNPLDGASILEIDRTAYSLDGAVIEWKGRSGNKYQLMTKDAVEGVWVPLDAPFIAETDDNGIISFQDSSADGRVRFYQVVALSR
ncbi:MAG TPA: DUF1416 domain-containing protein [Verrucomicrobiales bacterium]|nr:DUF1416 domain-containing protein [Verrucomicrobiales bacterium]HIL71821.1 DUF1416 domain-containing protein [Verrucomicrobiota bacterium]